MNEPTTAPENQSGPVDLNPAPIGLSAPDPDTPEAAAGAASESPPNALSDQTEAWKPTASAEFASSVGHDQPIAMLDTIEREPIDKEFAASRDGAETSPDDAPDPHTAEVDSRPVFADLGLSEPILRAVEEMGYRHPTPIQAQAIPFVLMGRDVLGVAQTGTGKTAGFTLPMLDILSGSRARARMPRSLILEPTRELALQVAENFVQYGKHLKLTHALIIGGESMTDQKDILMRGVDVLIATPGRLLDMFDRGSILLSDTRVLVIDEADRMLDMGFIPDVERIVSLLPANRQTLFFSATMGPEIRRLADAFLNDPKEIAVSRPATVATTITEGLALVAEHDKREALRRLIHKHDVRNALIFCNRKVDVDILFKSLTKHRFSVGALHGDMAQSIRFQTLEKFKAGELRLLVCSDVAARGIDIGGLSHVFNFDVPHHAEDYVHRIGRTGRAGLNGHAVTIAKPDDRFAVEAIEKLTGHPIPPLSVEGLDPVDWAEADGRRRRGRAAKAPSKRDDKPQASKAAPPRRRRDGETAPEATDRDQPNDALAKDRNDRPTRDRDDRSRGRDRGDARPSRDRDDTPRARDRDDTPRARDRDDTPRPRAWRDDPPRREWRRDNQYHDRGGRRGDDPGPSVIGFGDDVPAFMLLRARAPRPLDTTEADA